MKKIMHARILNAVIAVAAATLLSGCFDTKDDFTLNPDGSGKVVHETSFQSMNLGGENESAEAALKEAVAKIVEEAKGVEAWRDVSFKRLDDGRMYFKGTAYFKALSQLDLPNQTMLEFDWNKTADGGVLTLRTNKGDSSGEKEGFRMEKKKVDYSKLTPEERKKKLAEERAGFQQMKPMMNGILGAMKHEVTFHLPGKVAESSNFTKDPNGSLGLKFDGAKMVEAMDKLVNDDVWAMKNLGNAGSPDKPDMDDEMAAVMFGSKAPVRAIISGGKSAFDYATEVAAAKTEFVKIKKQLGASPVEVAAPAKGGELKSIKVVGVRLVSETDKQREVRPFNYDAGYTLALLAELPGSVLGITDKSGLDSAIADDGSDLLPKSEWNRRFSFPKLTKDKSGAVLEVELNPPGPGVKGLKELSGHLEYSVAGGSKEVDLGFTELKADAQGGELGAKIQSIKDGWQKGTQQLELKLKVNKDALKAVYLVVDGNKTELDQRGWGGGGNSYTFTYEIKGTFPANGKLVAEVFDQLQTFTVPFKLENITLLGAPMPAK
ncbi:MAG: hypothetical protein RLY20_1056 [Verrucomicrobiota bacterium]|jgi:hypothetical protein